MIQHYFIIAIRNICKYKLQSIISLLGLGISFACVSLAIYWNHYEVSFDSFHQNADRIYSARMLQTELNQIFGIAGDVIVPLKRDYQEVEKACGIQSNSVDIADSEKKMLFPEESVSFVEATSDVFDIFDFDWIAGNGQAVLSGVNKIAVSEAVANKIADGSPLGFKLLINKQLYEVSGIYRTWTTHSNLRPDILHIVPEMDEKSSCSIYALLRTGIDVEKFIRKIKNDTISYRFGSRQFPQVLNLWTPLKALHYTYPENERNVHMRDVYLFTGFAVLLSLCALLNYLTLFISRIRTRGRDMALRVMCGSSTGQLGVLLMTEYFLLLLASLLVSILFVEIAIPSFMELSQIAVERGSIYKGCGYLLVFILFMSLQLSLVPVFYFRRKVLRVQIDAVPVHLSNNGFRLTAVCLQLTVSLFFMFCTTMMMKQIHHLLYTDINVERKQIGVVQSQIGANRIMDILRQIPVVKEKVPLFNVLFPYVDGSSMSIHSWEGKAIDTPPISGRIVIINDSIAHFYDIELKEGTQTFNLQDKECLINETFARSMKTDNPVGKHLQSFGVVKGVVYDFQSQSPTSPVPAIVFCSTHSAFEPRSVAFKYEDDFLTVERIVREIFDRDGITYSLEDCEAEYRKLLKPEHNILKLLGVLFAVSMLMALFGIYALMVQACEKHRKEIAIRKVNGAHVINILSLFFRQYMQQVMVAAIIAFPTGYWVIKCWLEQYTLQTEISFWVFLFVFFSTVLLVTLCVGYNVWRAANENPANVIRKG